MNGFRTLALCAALSVLLFFDRAHLLWYALLAAILHESGHLLCYLLWVHRLPALSFGFTGMWFHLEQNRLPRKKEALLLLAGPGANLAAALVIGAVMQQHAALWGYFFLGENLLIGLFNLLPVSFLDGGRLLSLYYIGTARWMKPVSLAAVLLVGMAVLVGAEQNGQPAEALLAGPLVGWMLLRVLRE